MAYIELKNLDKSFGKNHVLKSIDLSIEKGSFVTLLGPSGCGKSTLLRCLAGLDEVSVGQIILDGQDITGLEAKKRNIGMVFQQYSLFPNMTVEENIAFGLKLKKLDKKIIRQKVKEAIEMVELCGKEKAYPSRLSGGQQQRVALARSVVVEPKGLLLDGPLNAIDAKLRKALQYNIKKISKELGLTCIFVTHDQNEAMVMSDKIFLLNEGKVEQSGDPISLYIRPKTHFAASFIGNYNILTREEFIRLTGENNVQAEEMAIRPETIELSAEHVKIEREYQCMGTIEESIPRGNILRYKVNVKGVILTSDVLFCDRVPFHNGNNVEVIIHKKDCIPIKHEISEETKRE